MKIKVLGFSWHLTGGVNVNQFRAILDAESKVRSDLLLKVLAKQPAPGWDGLLFAVADKPLSGGSNLWAGVILKIRDQERFCQVSQATGHLTLSAKALEEGARMVEINFFLFNPKVEKEFTNTTTTQRGLNPSPNCADGWSTLTSQSDNGRLR